MKKFIKFEKKFIDFEKGSRVSKEEFIDFENKFIYLKKTITNLEKERRKEQRKKKKKRERKRGRNKWMKNMYADTTSKVGDERMSEPLETGAGERACAVRASARPASATG